MRVQSYTFNLRPSEIVWFPSLPSTNDLAKELADQGRPEGTCVAADEQTAGRGRQGRAWHSPAGQGLYLSLILRPNLASPDLPLLTLMSAIAATEAVQGCCGAAAVDIKWPNDILLNGRKAGGILIESGFEGGRVKYAVVGIGCNLNHAAFPPEVSGRATSLRLETGRDFDRGDFALRLLDRMADWYDLLDRGGRQAVLDRWAELSSYARGRQVVVDLGGAQVSGTTGGLTGTGGLRLQRSDGTVQVINAGEIISLR